MDDVPETQYAKTGSVHIAYQVVGDGPIDLVLIPEWFSHIEASWDVAPLARTLRRRARAATGVDTVRAGCAAEEDRPQ